MISLASEITDGKGRRARVGWIFFDGECPVCTSLARRFRPALEARGFGLAPLQSARVRALLALPEEELLREMRLLTADGTVVGGAEALLHVARRIWWAWPLWALAQVPGVREQLARAYCWFATRRHCVSGTCIPALKPHRPDPQRVIL
jgi:predicted DCC family thiol-disulfide oxidoreductase YuxK